MFSGPEVWGVASENGPMSQDADDTAQTEQQEYLTREEFAALARISRATLGRYVAAGRVPFFQPGGPRHRMTIPRSALEQLTVPACSPEPIAKQQPADGGKLAPSSRKSRPGSKPKWLSNS